MNPIAKLILKIGVRIVIGTGCNVASYFIGKKLAREIEEAIKEWQAKNPKKSKKDVVVNVYENGTFELVPVGV